MIIKNIVISRQIANLFVEISCRRWAWGELRVRLGLVGLFGLAVTAAGDELRSGSSSGKLPQAAQQEESAREGGKGPAGEPGQRGGEASVGPIRLEWRDNFLTLRAPRLPGGEMKVLYLEAYCRPGSTDREWDRTVIPHRAELLEESPDGDRLVIQDRLEDGVVVRHAIEAGEGEVRFLIEAHNPTDKESEAHWAQPCIRVGAFAGTADQPDRYAYIRRSFIVRDDQPEFMPTRGWATEARYVPGQVWPAPGVPADDVNPRPVNPLPLEAGLIGCESGDGRWLFAVAFEPYQELFQGVIECLHSDFRLGGLKPGERKTVRGRIYLVPADFELLLARYRKDFPEHRPSAE